MIKCPNCAAELNYDPKVSMVTCKYCKTQFDPKKLDVKISKASEDNTFEGKSYICSSCGATLMTFDDTAITFCSYCGSQAMIESKMMTINNPDYIIPFKKTKEECIKSYKRVISKSLFAPNYMKSDIIVSKFRGIYMPYCTYKLSHHGITDNVGKKYYKRNGDYIFYNDYKITSEVDASYEGISYDLLSNFYDKFSEAIPYDFKQVEEFNPNYLSGFYADCGDVDNETYLKNALDIAEFDASKKLYKIPEYRKNGCNNPKVNLDEIEKKTSMFPVYFLAIRTKNNMKVNYAVINGQTGEVAADIPIDFKKYIVFSLILAIPVFLVLNWWLVITPKIVCGFSIFISIISIIISCIQIDNIDTRRNHLDDLAFKKKIDKKSITKTKRLKYIYKPLIAIFIGIFVLIMNFVHDYYYYGASILIFTLIILSFNDLVKLHNELVSSKLPQLEKRGGDERE